MRQIFYNIGNGVQEYNQLKYDRSDRIQNLKLNLLQKPRLGDKKMWKRYLKKYKFMLKHKQRDSKRYRGRQLVSYITKYKYLKQSKTKGLIYIKNKYNTTSLFYYKL